MQDSLLMFAIQWVAFTGSSLVGTWFLTQWRLKQLEAQRETDMKEIRLQFENIWKVTHENEKEYRTHIEDSYKERLGIANRFTDVLLTQNTQTIELKHLVVGITRMDTNIQSMTREVTDLIKDRRGMPRKEGE